MTERIPLVPADVNLTDFREMPLEFERLFASDTWVLGTHEEKVAAFHLWCKSWHQRPAGSLPDDDRVLAHLSAAGPRWKKIRPHALRGWVKCTDGRWYHPVVAEKVLRAWGAKIAQRTRTHNARVAALTKKIAAATGHEKEQLQVQLQALLQEPVLGVTGTKGSEEKGSEGKGLKPPEGSSAAGAADPAAVTRPTRQAYSAAYQERWRVEPIWDRQANSMMKQFVDKVGTEEAPAVAAFYVTHNRQDYVRAKHDVGLLLRDARGLRTEWATSRQVTDTEAREADKTATRGAAVHDLLREKRATS